MTALSAQRDTQEKAHPAAMVHAYTPAASTQFYKGGLVAIDSADGLLKKGATSATLVCVGVSQENYLSPATGARKLKARNGIHGPFANSAAADAIAADDVGKDCYIVDDQTVALTSNSSARSKAGTVYDVDSNGVWVHIAFPKP